MTDDQKMKAFLAENRVNGLVARYLAEVDGETASSSATRPIPTPQVRGIYRLRSERNESVGRPIQGFPELLAGLEMTAAESVVIHSLRTPQSVFALFTDAERNKFIGILRLPPTSRDQPPVAAEMMSGGSLAAADDQPVYFSPAPAPGQDSDRTRSNRR